MVRPRLFAATLLLFISSTVLCGQAGAQEYEQQLEILLAERLRISERTNLSLREEGRYVGLMNRQVDAYLSRGPANGLPAEYFGRVLAYAQTRRDLQQIGRPVESSYRAAVTVDPLTGFSAGAAFPSYAGIPSLPGVPLRSGATWEAPALITIDPPDGEGPVTLETVVSYRYDGLDSYAGEPVHRISATMATRYPYVVAQDEEPPPAIERGDIVRISGAHRITILLPLGPGPPLFLRDEITEQYVYSGGPGHEVAGHVLLFVHGIEARRADQTADSIESDLRSSNAGHVSVERTEEGTRITVHDVRFVADQATLLPEEVPRMRTLAAALAGLSGVRFLVVGHTADVGTVESQVSLSVERARLIARELASHGIDAALIDVEGRGGSEPLGDNSTEEGRAVNRRVEIYLLEQ